ncbi:MAG: hypothetical protein M1816_003433 [Peltula sp. TS41687]|nr:MAG: hypothetical protein M1816_003433 [Peltula sp. TS41687]
MENSNGRGSNLPTSTIDIYDENGMRHQNSIEILANAGLKVDASVHDQGQGFDAPHAGLTFTDGNPNGNLATTTTTTPMTHGELGTAQGVKLGGLTKGFNPGSSHRNEVSAVQGDRKNASVTVGDGTTGTTTMKSKSTDTNSVKGQLTERSPNAPQGIRASRINTNAVLQRTPAGSRRAPLRATNRARHLRPALFDIPGSGPGKENIPPGAVMDDSGKPDKPSGGKPGGRKRKPGNHPDGYMPITMNAESTSPQTVNHHSATSLSDAMNDLHLSAVFPTTQIPSLVESSNGTSTIRRDDAALSEEAERQAFETSEIGVLTRRILNLRGTLNMPICHATDLTQLSQRLEFRGHEQPPSAVLNGLQNFLCFEEGSVITCILDAYHSFKRDVGTSRAFDAFCALISEWLKEYPGFVIDLKPYAAQFLYRRAQRQIIGARGPTHNQFSMLMDDMLAEE